MTNIRLSIADYRDVETLNLYHSRKSTGIPEEAVMASIYAKSRNNVRTLMQWDSSPSAEFTAGVPWMPVNPNYQESNADAALSDKVAVFHYYQKLIALR